MVMDHRLVSIFLIGLFVFTVKSQHGIPLVSQCESGTSPVFLLQHNSTAGIRLRQVPTQNFIDCAELCSNNNDCVGIEYADGACHLIGIPPANAPKYEPADAQAPLAAKSCVKSERICASPFHFDVHEQMILVGFAREVVPADSLQVCLAACLNAFDTFGFECESLMYYSADAECILNSEDRLDRPDLFVEEHEDTVVYLDNNCAGSQCFAPYVTQYVSVEGRQLQEELDHSFSNIDLESCEQLCSQRVTITKNDFNCKSFTYNNETRTCILSDERSTPLGRGNLTEAQGFTYYEKKCFASPRTCRNVASFTRVPQMLLVGFAAFVMENVPSVTMCLDQCTNPPPETGEKFVCKSAMYYYSEQECILNAESRLTKPDLFIPEEEDFVVDYFDINCALKAETCGHGRQLQTIRSINAGLPEGDNSLHVIESVAGGVGECAKKCDAMTPEKCRSFNYDKEAKLCNLLYLDGKTTLRPQVKNGIDLYDMHCLAPQPNCQIKDGGALFSRYLYTKQPGLPTKEQSVVALSDCLEICLNTERCEGVNYNRRSGTCAIFAKIENNHGVVGVAHEHIDFYTNLCLVKEVDSVSISGAANVPKEIEVTTQLPRKDGEAVDRKDFLNKGQPTKKPVFREQDERRAPDSSDKKEPAITGKFEVGKTSKVAAPSGPPVLIPPSAVRTICNYEGMQVQIKNNVPFSGVIFVKNKYDTCRVEVVAASNTATLVMGLPSNFGMKPIVLNANASPEEKIAELKAAESREQHNEDGANSNEIRKRRQVASERDCGLVDMNNGTYHTTVVIQTNNLGIPGLVTSMDQIYDVSCDYSSMLGGKISTAANMTVHGPTPAVIQPKGKIELSNPVSMQMMMKGEAHRPVIQAKLGDILELRWEIMAMDEELDFFVKSCTAEPGVPTREDEQLQLIEDGCPTPAVAQKLIPEPVRVQSSAVKFAHLQAFRFDSSSNVRITCRLELCKGTCKPVTCNLLSGAQESWGRKKRAVTSPRNETDNDVIEFVTKRYKVPRYAQATTSLVIVDPLQQVNEPQAQMALQKHSPAVLDNQAVFETEIVAPDGQMCLNKWTLLTILGALLVIILVQAIIVGKYIFQRMLHMRAEDAAIKQYY